MDKMTFHKKDLYAIPNLLTYLRILLVPAFVLVYIYSKSLSGHIWAIVIVAVSALTDVVDGIIARKFNQITDLGKILDPIADKAMQFAMIFCIVIRYPIVWILFGIYAVKELVSLGFSGYLFRRGKHISGANWAGKICTVVLYAVMLALVVFPKVPDKIVKIMVAVSGALMILAFVVYMTAYFKLLVELKSEQKAEQNAEQLPEQKELSE